MLQLQLQILQVDFTDGKGRCVLWGHILHERQKRGEILAPLQLAAELGRIYFINYNCKPWETSILLINVILIPGTRSIRQRWGVCFVNTDRTQPVAEAEARWAQHRQTGTREGSSGSSRRGCLQDGELLLSSKNGPWSLPWPRLM